MKERSMKRKIFSMKKWVPGDMDYLEMALAFYAYLNCFEDEVLHRYHYTRDEIKEGMEDFWTDMDAVI